MEGLAVLVEANPGKARLVALAVLLAASCPMSGVGADPLDHITVAIAPTTMMVATPRVSAYQRLRTSVGDDGRQKIAVVADRGGLVGGDATVDGEQLSSSRARAGHVVSGSGTPVARPCAVSIERLVEILSGSVDAGSVRPAGGCRTERVSPAADADRVGRAVRSRDGDLARRIQLQSGVVTERERARGNTCGCRDSGARAERAAGLGRESWRWEGEAGDEKKGRASGCNRTT